MSVYYHVSKSLSRADVEDLLPRTTTSTLVIRRTCSGQTLSENSKMSPNPLVIPLAYEDLLG